MTRICIDNRMYEGLLTIGEMYSVSVASYDRAHVEFIDDLGEQRGARGSRFKPLLGVLIDEQDT